MPLPRRLECATQLFRIFFTLLHHIWSLVPILYWISCTSINILGLQPSCLLEHQNDCQDQWRSLPSSSVKATLIPLLHTHLRILEDICIYYMFCAKTEVTYICFIFYSRLLVLPSCFDAYSFIIQLEIRKCDLQLFS